MFGVKRQADMFGERMAGPEGAGARPNPDLGQSVREDVRKLLAHYGMVDGEPSSLMPALEQVLGTEDSRKIWKKLRDAEAGRTSMAPVYKMIKSLRAAAVMMSLQAEASTASGAAMLGALRPIFDGCQNAVDLGCLSAILAAHIAESYPGLRVVGVDRGTELSENVDACRRRAGPLPVPG